MNLPNNKAVFLDRDGVINKDKGLICRWEDFEIYPDAADGIKILNSLGFLVIVVTNQPVVARNMCSEDGVRAIHRKMALELGKKGARLDAVYFCPHHPDKGYPEENKSYKIDCGCRKPKPGMLLSAKEKFGINLGKSYIIGDNERDILAGKSAGCKTIFICQNKEKIKKAATMKAKPDFTEESLYSAAKLIQKQFKKN